MENHLPNVDSASSKKACNWCGKPLPPRLNTGGLTKRYCSNACRHSIHLAARRWAMQAIDNGTLDVAEIRKAPLAPYTVVQSANSMSGATHVAEQAEIESSHTKNRICESKDAA
jgi:hypothetical protein